MAITIDRRCGHCLTPITDEEFGTVLREGADRSRCVCGRHAITYLGHGITLVHQEGCDGALGRDCPCGEGLR